MEAKGSALRILIVEDDADTAESMAKLLRLFGHHVVVARDGPTALQIADADTSDVVLLDIAMPEMDGWRIAKEIRCHSQGRRPILIAISGYGAEGDKMRSQEVGIDLHLVKPVDAEELRKVLARYYRTDAMLGAQQS